MTDTADARSFISQLMEFFENSGFGALEIVVVAVFGLLIINLLMRLVRQALLSSPMDRSLISFVSALVHFALVLLLLLYCLDLMSINVTAIVAMVSALGLAIGLALQDLIGGVANGLVIINTKPFKVDDYVTIGDHGGTVREISLLHTVLVTPDNKKIILTNKSVYNSDIVNYSAYANRRLDLSFTIDYNSSLDEAKRIILAEAAATPKLFRNPAPFVGLAEQGDSGLVLTFRCWLKSGDYWPVKWELEERILKALVAAGVEIPFNQLTVSVRGDDPLLRELAGRRAEEDSK